MKQAVEQQSWSNPAAARPEPYPSAAKGWSAALVLSFLYVLSLLDRNIMVLLSQPIAQDLGLSDTGLGLLYGPGFAIFMAVTGLPLGWAIDRYSRRLVVWAGVLVWSLATVACGLSRSFTELLAARALVGTGEAVLVPGSQSILADMFPPKKMALPFSIYAMGGKIGQGLSFMLGGMLIMLFPVDTVFQTVFGHVKGWQLTFIIAGLPGVLLCFVMFLLPEPHRRRVSRPAESVNYTDYFRYMAVNWRFMVGLHLAIVVMMIVWTGITSWTPTFFFRVHGWNADQTGVWLGLVMAVGPLISIPVHGIMADRMFQAGRPDAHLRYLKIVLVLALPLLLIGYLVPNGWLALGLIGGAQALIVAQAGLLTSALQLMVPGEMRGKAGSIGLLVGGIGGMSVGPMLVAFFTESVFQRPDSVNLSLALSASVGIPLIAVLLSFAQKPMLSLRDGEA